MKAQIERRCTAEAWRAWKEPLEEEEPSSAQVKGFDIRVKDHRTPYVDMGIWGPFHRKILKAIKYRTRQPVGDGKYIQKEVPGPTNFDQFTTIWKVFVVGLQCRVAPDPFGPPPDVELSP